MEPVSFRKNSCESASVTDTAELAFPDWSGMNRFTPRLSPADALRLNEEYVRQLPAAPCRAETCEVEFVL